MVTDPIGAFPSRLRAILARRTPVTLQEEGARHAAVAVVCTLDDDPALLFVRRLERVGDPWSGHAAFPGGYRSNPDEVAIATAARETEEETGLPLSTAGTVLGQLDDIYPRSVHLPRVIVTPIVFSVPGQLPVRPVGEIEEALWVPVSHVFDRTNRRPFSLTLPTGDQQFESIHVAGLVVWGLTERILQQIVNLLH